MLLRCNWQTTNIKYREITKSELHGVGTGSVAIAVAARIYISFFLALLYSSLSLSPSLLNHYTILCVNHCSCQDQLGIPKLSGTKDNANMIAFTLLLSFLVAFVAAKATTCAKGAHVIVARGSLEPQGPGAMGELADKVLKLVPGSDMESLVYPALYNEYLDSQPAGVRALTSVIHNYVKTCPKTPLVLMGYSQGAHVIMDTICGASSTGFPATLPQPSYITDKISSVILLGDPSLTEGQTFHVGTSVGSGMFPRNLPAGCDSIANKAVSICDKGDPFCEAGGKNLDVHLGYIPVWGDYVVKEAVKFVKAVVKKHKACT